MNAQAQRLWSRAQEALRVARHDLPVSADAAASRAYYAALYAVSALFALRGRTFRKHTAVEAAVHRDLVKSGQWPPALGEAYSNLLRVRSMSDYGQEECATPETAAKAIEAATDILKAVARANPLEFGNLFEP